MIKHRLNLFFLLLLVLLSINTLATILVFNYETQIDFGGHTLKVLHMGDHQLEMIDDQGRLLKASFVPNENFERFYPYDGRYQILYKDISIATESVEAYKRSYTENGQSQEIPIFIYRQVNRQNTGQLGIMVERTQAIYKGPYIKSLLLTNLVMVMILFLTINPISLKDSSISIRKGQLTLGLDEWIGIALIVILLITQIGMITYTGRLTSVNNQSLWTQWFILVPIAFNLIIVIGNKFFSYVKQVKE